MSAGPVPAKPIAIEEVSKSFSTSDGRLVHALRDVNIDVPAGDFLSLIGPSGCGKSTLLNMLAGLEFPDSGSIQINRKEVSGPDPRHGMVFQEYALFPWMTVWGNIEIGLRYQCVAKAERDRRVADLVALMGLNGFERAFPKELSGGMKQRVALARAYAPEPDILLLDEPFGALDAQTKTLLQEDLLRTWSSARQTVVFITHDVDEAVFLSQRVIVLSRRPGRVFREFWIDLPYPRTRATRTSSEYFRLRNEVWETVYSIVELTASR
jgi:NitT/TauT family transport system ATP-binding protein